MKTIFIFASFLLLISCANIKLSEAGSKVQIIQQISISDLKHYQSVGDIDCKFGFNAKSSTTNIKQCRIELKNKAAELGAEIVVIAHQKLGANPSFGVGQSYNTGCPNCISMVGTAYRSIQESR
ncbi:hypothetical protein [uncultured Microbulbifer sp.]|uniref:hypothetical protein n=1 Tax=uncultured Microbulbifer sp. TaxID=348147 RepID=UPI002608E7D6|nr:hypothetical protein [uncultured Microbulbifer sp.]